MDELINITGYVVGGHINPAVSLAMVVTGDLPVYKFPFYMISQYLGAFVASACVYGVYYGKQGNVIKCWDNLQTKNVLMG